jgi:hypothetical protein
MAKRSDKLLAIDKEIQALMLLESKDGILGKGKNSSLTSSAYFLSAESQSIKRTNKHKMKSLGPNQLEKWRTHATDEDGNAVRLFLKKCAKWVKKNNDIPGNLFSREALESIKFLMGHEMINSDSFIKKGAYKLTKSTPVPVSNIHYPAISYSDTDGNIQGFDFLNFKFNDVHGREWKVD